MKVWIETPCAACGGPAMVRRADYDAERAYIKRVNAERKQHQAERPKDKQRAPETERPWFCGMKCFQVARDKESPGGNSEAYRKAASRAGQAAARSRKARAAAW